MTLSWHQQRAAGMHALPYDVVGYTYKADIYCPDCTLAIVGEEHGLDTGSHLRSYETILARWAEMLGFDREDESSYDSDAFPKVVFREDGEWSDTPTRCGACGGELS